MHKRRQINHNDKYVVLFEFDESDDLATVGRNRQSEEDDD